MGFNTEAWNANVEIFSKFLPDESAVPKEGSQDVKYRVKMKDGNVTEVTTDIVGKILGGRTTTNVLGKFSSEGTAGSMALSAKAIETADEQFHEILEPVEHFVNNIKRQENDIKNMLKSISRLEEMGAGAVGDSELGVQLAEERRKLDQATENLTTSIQQGPNIEVLQRLKETVKSQEACMSMVVNTYGKSQHKTGESLKMIEAQERFLKYRNRLEKLCNFLEVRERRVLGEGVKEPSKSPVDLQFVFLRLINDFRDRMPMPKLEEKDLSGQTRFKFSLTTQRDGSTVINKAYPSYIWSPPSIQENVTVMDKAVKRLKETVKTIKGCHDYLLHLEQAPDVSQKQKTEARKTYDEAFEIIITEANSTLDSLKHVYSTFEADTAKGSIADLRNLRKHVQAYEKLLKALSRLSG